jgi:16S rRNA (uracil1498-N3)-methyltransferase
MRFYCEKIQQGTVELSKRESHHLISVYRKNKGEQITVFDGKGIIASAKLVDIKHKTAFINIETVHKYPKPENGRIVIAASVAKSDKFDKIITQCTELGADEIAAVVFDRTVKKPKNEKVIDRWNKLAITAAKQCERVFLPKITAPMTLKESFRKLKNRLNNPCFIYGDIASHCGLNEIYQKNRDFVVFVGAEGGFSETELDFFKNNQICSVRINENILRIETAAGAFAALLENLKMP